MNAVARLIATAVLGCVGTACGPMSLISSDSAAVQIVLPAVPSAAEARAAELLADHLSRWTGARVPVVADDASEADTEIAIGLGARAADAGVDVDVAALGDDGFHLRSVDGTLFIIGGSEKGPVYGAVEFLETHLGFRLYAPGVLVMPEAAPLTIPAGLNDTQIPPIEFRELFYRHAWDPQFAEWHRVDRHVVEWGLWVHTFAPLVPPDEHFHEHPEWFAEVNGKRIPNGQLCLTNDGLFHELVSRLRERIEAEPHKRYWSVSQNDTFGYCTCDACAAIDAEQEAHSGSLIVFINRVAAEFPDYTISTLAYQYSRKAPKTLRPADNVLVVLAPIELNRSRPVATDPSARVFRAEMEEWNRVTDRLLIWDYVIQFANLVSPFPNLRVLQPNLRWFVDNGAVAHFQQGNREIAGEWAELRGYVIGKLLWNLDADVDALIDDFLVGYYGPGAAPHLRAYIDQQHDALAESGSGLGIFGNPIGASRTYLTPALMEQYEALFDSAAAAAAVDDEAAGHRPQTDAVAGSATPTEFASPSASTYSQRVRWARQPIEYARLEQAKTRATGPFGLFERVDGRWVTQPAIQTRLDQFVAAVNEQGVTRVTEWHTTPDEYHEQYQQVLSRVPLDHLAVGQQPALTPEHSARYPADGATTLTDGLHGPVDHRYGWLGWEGEHMEAVVDLGSTQTVDAVRMDFLQTVGSWIWMPLRLEVSLSDDGTTWRDAGVAHVATDERQGGALTETFQVDTGAQQARFVRARAVSRLQCPDWHGGGGGKAWIFADELVVLGAAD